MSGQSKLSNQERVNLRNVIKNKFNEKVFAGFLCPFCLYHADLSDAKIMHAYHHNLDELKLAFLGKYFKPMRTENERFKLVEKFTNTYVVFDGDIFNICRGKYRQDFNLPEFHGLYATLTEIYDNLHRWPNEQTLVDHVCRAHDIETDELSTNWNGYLDGMSRDMKNDIISKTLHKYLIFNKNRVLEPADLLNLNEPTIIFKLFSDVIISSEFRTKILQSNFDLLSNISVWTEFDTSCRHEKRPHHRFI